jgi:hypothetical protein
MPQITLPVLSKEGEIPIIDTRMVSEEAEAGENPIYVVEECHDMRG